MEKDKGLPKSQRLHSKKLIDAMFGGKKSRAVSVFPLRMVFMPLEGEETSQMLISAPKRCLHRANKRNRIKRLVREAYRKNKSIIAGHSLAIAFIWLDNKLWTSEAVEKRVVSLLNKAVEEQ